MTPLARTLVSAASRLIGTLFAVTPNPVSVEEYLRTSYEPEMEYVDGQLVDRHVGEYIHIWVVDPYKRTLSEVVHGVIRRTTATVLATPLVGEIDFAAIFQQLDEPTE